MLRHDQPQLKNFIRFAELLASRLEKLLALKNIEIVKEPVNKNCRLYFSFCVLRETQLQASYPQLQTFGVSVGGNCQNLFNFLLINSQRGNLIQRLTINFSSKLIFPTYVIFVKASTKLCLNVSRLQNFF